MGVTRDTGLVTVDSLFENPARYNYRIYSNKHPGRLFNFWTFRLGAIGGRALIKFSPCSAGKRFIL